MNFPRTKQIVDNGVFGISYFDAAGRNINTPATRATERFMKRNLIDFAFAPARLELVAAIELAIEQTAAEYGAASSADQAAIAGVARAAVTGPFQDACVGLVVDRINRVFADVAAERQVEEADLRAWLAQAVT